MARVVFVKVFSGLNLGVSQLSAELRRKGHETRIIFFKEYRVVPEAEVVHFEHAALSGPWIAARAEVYNFNCYTKFTDEELQLLVDELRAFRPDLIGFSMSSMSVPESAMVTQHVKRYFDVPVIWGGSGPTLEPERCLEYADAVCVGEGEEAIVELADAIDAGRDWSTIPNLWVNRGGAVVKNPTRPLVNLEDIAIPDFDESRLVYVTDGRVRRNLYPPNFGRQYHIMTQRGCPYSCSFCIESWYQDKFGKKDSLRRRSVDVVIEELVRAKAKHGIKAVLFFDDVFTVNPKWLREFAPRYKAEVGLPFWCYTYPRTTRAEDLRLLKDAGLKSITIGIQSGSYGVLKEYNRPVQPDLAIQAMKLVVEAGLDGYFEMITKSEYDTEERLRESFEFLLAVPKEMRTFGFYPMVKFPGYDYTEKVRANHLQIAVSDEDYLYYHKIYLLTRTRFSRRLVRTIGESKLVRRLMRRYPKLIDPLLPAKLPLFQLADYAFENPERQEHAPAYDPSRDEGWIGFVVPQDSTKSSTGALAS